MKRIVFMGTPDFAVPILKQLLDDKYEVVLVVTQPDRPKGRKRILSAPPVKEEALKHDLPVFQPEKVKDSFQEILAYQPDLIVTAAFGQILPKGLLDAPEYGCINVHASLLPELRGGAPIHYAIMQGKKETGITLMYMAEALDAGAIIDQVAVPIEIDDHVGILHDKLADAGAQLLHKTLPALFDGTVTSEEQDDRLATYAPNITRAQEQIDWQRSATDVYNQIRGLHPWPVASTTIAGQNLKIWWAELSSMKTDQAPGAIIEVTNDGIYIACGGKTVIKLTDIQLSGKKRMTVREYLNGRSEMFKIGMKLGE
ncbi:methionyl-tRNA formyltransferase [Amphibacillus sediminis]|uniref:methionyl-tRNA formyltransferase n=1 Tax=Amphibacillus sediminis TaxID=360185 RepID=UPI000829FCD7|nr:methionyl-tRNA formyltransferase [Amphibacillus sediminis]